ncbi:hypothetical protein HA402_006015 [Bradysia odoriphaga]|nr:hypothetical protein HA402_006015 [Bradysia odoriphaga]
MANKNNLNVGMRCIKYMLVVINLMFLLTSILLITVGTTIQSIYGDFKEFLDNHFMSIPSLLVAVGFVMLVVAAFGIIGAFKESTMLTNIYACLLSLVFVLEISAAIAGFVLQGQVREMLVRTMNESITAYTKYETAAVAVDFMQRSLQCCGVDGPGDWYGILPETDSESGSVLVPESCCGDFEGLKCDEYFMSGCLDRMHFIIGQSAMMIATGATTVAFVQILGVMCAFMLAKTIRRTKSLRAAKRWQLHQSLGIIAGNDKPDYDDYTQLDKSVTYNAK